MFTLQELEHALRALLASGGVEIIEDGRRQPVVGQLHWEMLAFGGEPRIHLWCEQWNLVRSIQQVDELSENRIVLSVRRFGRRTPGRIELIAQGQATIPRRLSRAVFLHRFRSLLEEGFPDDRLVHLVMASDLEHSFSGAHARGIQVRGPRGFALVGVGGEEESPVVDGILTTGLLWYDWLRRRAKPWVLAGLRVFVPRGHSLGLALRLRGLRQELTIQLYEYDPEQWRLRPVDVRDTGNLQTELSPLRQTQLLLEQARSLVERIQRLVPDAIDAAVVPGRAEVAIRVRGLEIARWRGGQCLYGYPERNRELTEQNWSRFARWVKGVAARRHPAARDRQNRYYRAQAERWLEAMILREPTTVEAQLRPEFLYAQVPAWVGGDRGVIDLLGVTRSGRLAVFELKVNESLHLPLQALDYWTTVYLHQKQDQFRRYGYFPGVELQEKPPLLYLVAPALRFHSTLEMILQYFSPEVEVICVGLREDWRNGLRVVHRHWATRRSVSGSRK
ncbi:MAG: hypothetical protein K6U09_06885 [Acidobacteriia bacterium]|jgi:hypothetical protein|nr:hypothetical protein [Terriglobia bacterium]